MFTDHDIARERRALAAGAARAEAESLDARGRRFVVTGGARVGERDRARMTEQQRQCLANGDSVVEWIDNDGEHWDHGVPDVMWPLALMLPLDVPVWVNGYRITRMTAAELQQLADSIARGDA
jgi:hypothetical protein